MLVIGSALALGLRLAPAGIWTAFFGPQFSIAGKYGLPYLLSLYAATTVVYSLSVVIIAYEMSYKIANTSWVQLAFSGAVVGGHLPVSFVSAASDLDTTCADAGSAHCCRMAIPN